MLYVYAWFELPFNPLLNVNVEREIPMRKALVAKALIISIVVSFTIFFKVSTGHAFSTYDTDQGLENW